MLTAYSHVRIYQWTGNAWIQSGDDIDGVDIYSGSGFSVSISADGNTVAIGAPHNEGSLLPAGHVRVFSMPHLQTSNPLPVNKNLSIYPNPVSNKAFIEYKYFNTKAYSIRILDAKGVVVFERHKITDSKTIFDRKNLSAGVYFVEVIDEGVLRRKMVVQ